MRLVIIKQQYQNHSYTFENFRDDENGKKLVANIKFHSGPDSGSTSCAFEKKAGWDLFWGVGGGHLEDIDKEGFPPWVGFGLQSVIPHHL